MTQLHAQPYGLPMQVFYQRLQGAALHYTLIGKDIFPLATLGDH